ncbi:ferrous iron transport protein A [bacterium]|nr:ferrous iron transport protein A [bacterium]MCB2179399.1 ferrous iron transport protein A [bacterium]
MQNKHLIPLTDAKPGAKLHLAKIQGGKQITRRLVELGLTPGVQIRKLQDTGGPVILAIRDSRIALGRGMAEKLFVTNEENE